MGWTFSHDWTKRSLIQHLTEDNGVKTIAKTVRGNVLWAVQEQADKRFIACYLMGTGGQRDGGWGYKDMDESSGPNDINCPLSYLDMVPDPGGYATAWRARVRSKALRNAAIRSAKPGDVIVLRPGCKPNRLRVESLRPFRARDVETHILYRVPKRHIASVENETFRAFDTADRLGASDADLKQITNETAPRGATP